MTIGGRELIDDNIEWDTPPEDDYIEWEYPNGNPSKRTKFNLTKKFGDLVRRVNPRWVMVILLAGLVITSSIIITQNIRIIQLETELDTLQSEYDSLQENYDALLSDYSDLFSDFQALEAAFEDPLVNPVTPTYSQIRNWLAQDTTDECEYVAGVWSCGDYAAMLMTRAKEMNWRIRIAVIFYSLEGEPYYGSTSSVYGSHGHAFNVIECTDGIWYIEPQSDGLWYIISGVTQERIEFEIYSYYDFVDAEDTVWDGYHWWTNFYSQFA